MSDPTTCIVTLRHKWEDVGPTDGTCLGLTRALQESGYVATIARDNEQWYFLGEERLEEPFTYCPWCGRKLVLRE